MDKPAWVVMQLDKVNDRFWLPLVENANDKNVEDVGNTLVVTLKVKSYSLEDHQFIPTKLDALGGSELVVLLPRSIVKTIVEGKTDLRAAFSFAGSKLK